MRLLFWFIVTFTIVSCAQQVSPNGGPKDELAPKVQGYKPENKSTHFNAEKITIKFDEYIQIKDPSQIVISPFLKDKPQIDAIGKNIEIVFLKSKPEPNTTYTINFGNSISDVNEGNVISNFTYVFATGEVLDSNKLSGVLLTGFKNEPIKNAVVALYRTQNYTDTTIYKKYPGYFSKSKEDGSFLVENLPNDSFYLFAFEDANSDNKYQKNENVAFEEKAVIPNTLEQKTTLKLFERYAYPIDYITDTIIKQKGKIQFPIYRYQNLTIQYLGSEKIYKQIVKGTAYTDTLNIFIPSIKDTVVPRFKQLKGDSITFFQVKPKGKIKTPEFILSFIGPTKPGDSIKIFSNTPIDSISLKSIIIKEDTIPISKVKLIQRSNFEWDLVTDLKENTSYSILIEDSVIMNAYGRYNKKQQINFVSPESKNFGNLILSIESAKLTNTILQIVEDTKEEKVIETFYKPVSGVTTVKNLKPGNYKLKVVIDRNLNGKWDNGDLEKMLQPESVFYDPQIITIKAYWDIEQSINIDKIINN